jgi:hypothetical protein
MCPVTVQVTALEDLPAPLPAQFHYDMTDPYAVRLSLGAPETRPVNWVFARDLLAEGMRRPAGIGNVLVFPRHRCRPHFIRVILRSSAGVALVEIPASEVAAFLRQTFLLVPSGSESLYIDLDGTVAELRGRRH